MNNLTSKIFIDGGEPEETREANELMLKHFNKPLDGQTTNPTLIAKNLAARSQGKITEEEALGEYKKIVQEISNTIPQGSVSIQVFADRNTLASDMLAQAKLRKSWIPNASIKFPCTPEGLKAVSQACKEMPVNVTLVFSQAQAAAVYQATIDTKYPIFISPFVGRLDDKGENGMDVIKNIKEIYKNRDGHVEVLTASVRSIEHILYAIKLQSEIITIPSKVFKLWALAKFPIPDENYSYKSQDFKPIGYDSSIKLDRDFTDYDIHHDLTDRGIDAFFADWMNLFK